MKTVITFLLLLLALPTTGSAQFGSIQLPVGSTGDGFLFLPGGSVTDAQTMAESQARDIARTNLEEECLEMEQVLPVDCVFIGIGNEVLKITGSGGDSFSEGAVGWASCSATGNCIYLCTGSGDPMESPPSAAMIDQDLELDINRAGH